MESKRFFSVDQLSSLNGSVQICTLDIGLFYCVFWFNGNITQRIKQNPHHYKMHPIPVRNSGFFSIPTCQPVRKLLSTFLYYNYN